MLAPDALHRTDADALNLGHGGGGPVRRLAGRISLGGRDDAGCNPGFERWDTRRACLVTQQASDTIGHEAFLPALDNRLADTCIAHDLGGAAAVRRQQYDLCPPDVLLRSVSVRHDRVQLATICGTHFNFDAGSHPQTRISAKSRESQIGPKRQILSTRWFDLDQCIIINIM
jgi:hypothetical protein